MKPLNTLLLASIIIFSANNYALEITPLFGYRGGGKVVETDPNQTHTLISADFYGLILGTPYEHNKTLELYYSHQSTRVQSVNISTPRLPAPANKTSLPLSIDYLHIGGITPIDNEKRLTTFASGGIGFTYLKPAISGLNAEFRPSLSIGLGAKWRLTRHLALRLESRVLATMFSNNSSLFCNGGCTLTVKGRFLIQEEVFAGLAVKF